MSQRQPAIPFPPDLDFSKQAVVVPGTKRPGESGHHRNAIWGLFDSQTPGIMTVGEQIWQSGLAYSRHRPCLGRRPQISVDPPKFADHYVWQTYAQVDERRQNVGSALHHMFSTGELGGTDLPTVGVWSQNRPEWQILDLACQGYSKVLVPLYDTLGKDSVEYIINHAELTVIFATPQHIPALLASSSQTPRLKMIVSFDELSPDTKNALVSWGKTVNLQIWTLREIEALGNTNHIDPLPIKMTDIMTICYTSGTTGPPKGVVIDNSTFATATNANLYGSPFKDNSVVISYLPLAHIYERVAEAIVIALGGRIGYFSGDPLRLLEDCQILKPDFFPAVPRILNRVYQAAMTAGDVPGLKGAIFRKAVQVKLDRLHTTGEYTHALWDRLVFRKIQAVLGGNVKLISCGAAPINANVMDFLKIALATQVLEGEQYGMTETIGTCTKTFPMDPSSSGMVGGPQPINDIKLVDVSAMGYTSEDKPFPRGEICVRGGNCFKYYYKDEQNTKATIDEEGWLHTGDVGEIDEKGRLKIIDRVKNIMKLAQGEYVALEKVENMHSSLPLVAQIFAHGDSLQSYLIGVVVPDPVQLAALASSVLNTKIDPTDGVRLGEVIKDPLLKDVIFKALREEGLKMGLKGFETLKKIHISLDPFTVDNNCMTPTLKLRRKNCYTKFKKELDALYAADEPPIGAKL